MSETTETTHALCATHPRWPLLAVAIGAAGGAEAKILQLESLRLCGQQSLDDDVVLALAWHPRRLCLALLAKRRTGSARIHFLVADRHDRPSFRSHGSLWDRQLTAAPLAAVCWADQQLLLGGEMLSVCPLDARLCLVAERCESQKLPADQHIEHLQMETSERFMVSLHRGAVLRVWWACEAAGPAEFRRRRQGLLETVLGCSSEVLERGCVAARWAPGKRRKVPGISPALLVSLSLERGGRVTVWRESCFDEACAFLPEACWSAGSGSAVSWVAPVWTEEEVPKTSFAEDKAAPLRAAEHGAWRRAGLGSSASPSPMQLVIMHQDGSTMLLTLQHQQDAPMTINQEALLSPPEPPALRSFCDSGTNSSGGLLLVRQGREKTWDFWLCSRSGDLQRMRWEMGHVQTVISVAVAGAVIPPAEAHHVMSMAVHHSWGFVAVLLGMATEGSVVVLYEMPLSRAELASGQYQVPAGHSLHQDALASFIGPETLDVLCWVPGRGLPPRLLALGHSGALRAVSMQEKVWLEVCWGEGPGTPVLGVRSLEVASHEEDSPIALLVEEDGLCCILADVEVFSSAFRAPWLKVRWRCRMDAGTSPCMALEWLGDGAQQGAVAGQLALCSTQQVEVMTLCMEDPSTGTISSTSTLTAALKGDAVLQLVLCDERLMALTAKEVLVWLLLEGQDATLSYSYALPSRPVQGSAVSQSPEDGTCRGKLALQRRAGGALLLLASVSSEAFVAPPTALQCHYGTTGYAWQVIDLHCEALPFEPASWLAATWTAEGTAVLMAGYAGGEGSLRRLSLMVAALPQAAQGSLRATVPCPAYHPDTLIWLLRRGEAALARRVTRQLLDVLRQSGDHGISPVVGMALEEFHCEPPKQEVQGTEPIQGGEGASETAADLFGDDDMEARLARLSKGWMTEDESPEHKAEEASGQDVAGWQLDDKDLEELSRYLQTTSLPVSAHAQARLMVLLQDIGAVAHAGDLDESGQRFMKAFEVHVAVRRWQLRSPNAETFLEKLSSEDMCWALHSDCQGTIVDRILEALGSDLDWPALRSAGLGLWLHDLAALKKVLEQLPRVLLRRQAQAEDLQPESVALWYALLGRRTLLGQLYRQSKQDRVADFLSNDLSVEPWKSKAEKNAFELVRQRRFHLACAFFIFGDQSHDALDVCVRYMEDWPLALLIAHHTRAERAGTAAAEAVTAELRRVLVEDLLPLATRAQDPWLASLIHWHLGDHCEAVLSVARPCNGPSVGGAANLFSSGSLQHAGFSPGLPRFLSLLQGILAKRNEVVMVPEAWLQETSSMSAIARAYLSRRQPLLALPPAEEDLPWRTAVAVARAVMFLYCVSGQDLSELAEVLQVLRKRLGLTKMSWGILSKVQKQASWEAMTAVEIWEASTKVAEFYAPSQVRGRKMAKLPKKREKVAEMAGPSALWLLPCLAAEGNASELRLCLTIRCLAEPYAARGFHWAATSSMLPAVAWRVLPCLRQYMEAPEAAAPLTVMNLVVHVVCAACISLPPPTFGEASAEPVEISQDMFHVLTTLVLVVILLLSLRGLTTTFSSEEEMDSFSSILALLEQEKRQQEDLDEPEVGATSPPDWEPLLWQGLRVLLEQLKGPSTEQRRLLRCGALPSMVSTLFLQQTSREVAEAAATGEGSGAASTVARSLRSAWGPGSPGSGSDTERKGRTGRPTDPRRLEATLAKLAAALESSLALSKCVRGLLGCAVAELSMERLLLLFSGIRRRSVNSSGHWITAWYDALVDSLRQLQSHVRSKLFEAASEACDTFDRWPLALCAPEPQLSSVLASAFGTSADAFLALWRQLNGTRRLVLLFAHHPRLLSPSSKLTRQSATLVPGGASLRFLCCDRSGGALQVAVQAKGGQGPWLLHAGHAARWKATQDAAEAYAMAALASASSASSSVNFDANAEFLLGGSSGELAAADEDMSDRGPEVQHFLATLRLPQAEPQAEAGRQRLISPRVPLVDAESHPSKSMFAAASEDGTVQLWSFGRRLLRQLPRPSGAASRSPGGADRAEAGSAAGASAGRWQLAWSESGHRLLAVQSAPGTSSCVNLWALAGDQLHGTYSLQTGAAHARLLCATFASHTGSVVATAGRRSDPEFTAPGVALPGGPTQKAWPHVAAGICVWDSTAPRTSSLIAHDGAEAAFSSAMPPEYGCMTWVPSQQRLLCGTKTGELRAFDLRMKRWAQRLEAHSDAVRYCFVIESTGQLCTLSEAAELKVWSVKHLELIDTVSALHQPRGVATSVGLSSKALSCAALLSDRQLITGGQDGSVVLTRL